MNAEFLSYVAFTVNISASSAPLVTVHLSPPSPLTVYTNKRQYRKRDQAAGYVQREKIAVSLLCRKEQLSNSQFQR